MNYEAPASTDALILYSGYLGKIDIGIPSNPVPITNQIPSTIPEDTDCVMERVMVFGGRAVRVKVIDARRAGLNIDVDYPVAALDAHPPMRIQVRENEYHEYCKLRLLREIREREGPWSPWYDRSLIHLLDDWIGILAPAHRERAETEYPAMAALNGLDMDALKHLYHTFLVRMVPIDILFSVCNYLTFLWERFRVFSIQNLEVLICLANVPQFENAFWQGSYAVFGNGGRSLYPLASVDVIGHELSHGIIESYARLAYQGHAGALNESFADVIGSQFETYLYTKYDFIGVSNWCIGENITKVEHARNLRNLANPHRSMHPQPKSIGDTYYVDPAGDIDHGGVHVNSGIPNYCFYLLSQLVGTTRALNLYFLTLQKITSHATLVDFGRTLLQVAKPSERRCIRACLDETGIVVLERRWRPRIGMGCCGA